MATATRYRKRLYAVSLFFIIYKIGLGVFILLISLKGFCYIKNFKYVHICHIIIGLSEFIWPGLHYIFDLEKKLIMDSEKDNFIAIFPASKKPNGAEI